MAEKNIHKKVYNFVRDKRNNGYAIRLVADLYDELQKANAKNWLLQHENELLEHQLEMAEKYILG